MDSKFVVVGAGLAGAATAWQLAAAGHEVTLLERAEPGHAGGSSHGSSRIVRAAYTDPFYARLAVEARGAWTELEAAAGTRLVTPSDAVDLGPDRDPAVIGPALDAVGVDHEVLDAAAARERWPGIAFDTPVVRHTGGVLDALGAVATMTALARGHGARVLTGWPVASVREQGAGYRLTSSAGEHVDAERVVVCAGGWLPELLDDLPLPAAFRSALPSFTVREEQVFHFPVRDESPWPTFIHKSPAIQTYGLPGGRDAGYRGVKVAEYAAGPVLPGASARSGRVDPANRERVVDFVRRTLPGLVPEPYAEATCLFTLTPTEDFVIDRADGIVVASPCSGHGAKFAPLVGRIVAELAADGTPAPARFSVGATTGA